MADRAQGHHIEEEWENQPVNLEELVFAEEQPAGLRQSLPVVFIAKVIIEKLLGLVSTSMKYRWAAHGQFLVTAVKATDLGK